MTTTLYAYDANGNRVQEQAPNGDVTYNLDDGANRLIQVQLTPAQQGQTSAASSVTQYIYDDADNVTAINAANGDGQSTTYDGDNRAQC